jgi:hypothetical protein
MSPETELTKIQKALLKTYPVVKGQQADTTPLKIWQAIHRSQKNSTKTDGSEELSETSEE